MGYRALPTECGSIRVLVCADVSDHFRRRAEQLCRPLYVAKPGGTVSPGNVDDVEVVVVRSPFKLQADLVARALRLRAVIRAGSGLDGLPDQLLLARGIAVHTVPLAAASVAEHAFCLLLAVGRNLPALHSSTASGAWDKASANGLELRGKTLLIVGFGQIGRAVARIADGFGLNVLIVDPSPGKAEKLEAIASKQNWQFTDLDEGLTRSNFVILCCPLNSGTRYLVDARRLALLPADSVLVNVARAEIVEPQSLKESLAAGRLHGAGLDVHYGEPRPDLGLLSLPNVVCSPHIGAQTRDARRRIENQVLALLEEYA